MSDIIVVRREMNLEGHPGSWYWRTEDHGNHKVLATSEIYSDRTEAMSTAFDYARDHRLAMYVDNDPATTPDLFYEPPECVTLCGSTRFWEAFQEWSLRFTMQGVIVLSVGAATASDTEHGITEEEKIKLDDLHKRKIDMSDAIFVLNVGGYIGDSTRSEVAYAKSRGKHIMWLDYDSAPAEYL